MLVVLRNNKLYNHLVEESDYPLQTLMILLHFATNIIK